MVREIKQFQVDDKIFDNWGDAYKYEQETKLQKTKDNVERHMKYYRKRTKTFLSNERKYPFLIVFDHEWDTKYYMIANEDEMINVMISIAKLCNDYQLYMDETKVLYDHIIETDDNEALIGFVFDRAYNKYENIDLENFKNVS